MTPQDRKTAELQDRVNRLTRQCAELQARNRELELAMKDVFRVAREVSV